MYEHLRVKTQTSTVMTPPARVGYEKVDNRKGKYLPVGFTIFYIDPLQHVDSSCSIYFLEHTSPVLKKKKENLNLKSNLPGDGGWPDSLALAEFRKKALSNVGRKIFWIHGNTFYVEGIAKLSISPSMLPSSNKHT